jgi:hypothetical protein
MGRKAKNNLELHTNESTHRQCLAEAEQIEGAEAEPTEEPTIKIGKT